MNIKYAKRDDSVAIAKAIGIILVVVGHCSFSEISSSWHKTLHDFIYLFHMPLFFFLSGYFFQWKYLTEKKTFIRKKIKGLWVPYVKWVFAFILLHNILWKIGMFGMDVNTGEEGPCLYTCIDILKRVPTVLLMMTGEQQLLGGFWFIPVLFFSAIYSLLFLSLFKSLFDELNIDMIVNNHLIRESKRSIIVGGAIIFFIALGMVGMHNGLTIAFMLTPRTCLASSLFLTGFFWHDIETKMKFPYKKYYGSLAYVVLAAIIIMAASKFHYSSLPAIQSGEWYDIPYLWFLGVIGTLMVVFLSRGIVLFASDKLVSPLMYIGENTMVILALHISFFKLVNIMKVHYYNLSIPYGVYPIIKNDPSNNGLIWWMLYAVIGVGMPILFKKLYDVTLVKNKNNEK